MKTAIVVAIVGALFVVALVVGLTARSLSAAPTESTETVKATCGCAASGACTCSSTDGACGCGCGMKSSVCGCRAK